ncbi:MAG: thioesterase family protein [Leptospira sp.]|nr:thioesterase family protein [Leptospira sp.]
MSRLELKIPEAEIYSSQIQVRISDINFAGHLAHDAILSLVHQIRAEFFFKNGWTEVDVEGKGIVISDVGIVYKSEAFFPDILFARMFVHDISKKSLDFYYQLLHSETKKEVAVAKTGIVFFDYSIRKPCLIPDTFLAAVSK